jgi:DNA-directed RNA polymerase specialized sigma24 family protein
MDCGKCDNYDNGKGKKACLKCKKYLYLVLKSGRRSPIVFERIPESIYNNIADPDFDERMPELLNAMRMLPADLSIIMAAHYVLDLNQREIAGILRTSIPSISRKLTESVKQLKNIIRNKYK